jgi:acyl-CoA synthetase (NDP forming)
VGFAEVQTSSRRTATRVIGLHIEGVDDGRALYETVGRVSSRKPVGLEGRAFGRRRFALRTGRLIGDFVVTRAAGQAARSAT